MDLSNKILTDMQLAVKKGAEVLDHYFGRALVVEKKFKAGLVTQADRESESVITETLSHMGYDFEMVGEESFGQNMWEPHSEKPYWILDPLDGTTNFVHGFPVFAISLALYQKGRVQIGVVLAPKMGRDGELYTAIRGQGAYLNQTKLNVSSCVRIDEAFLATGFFSEDEAQLQEQLLIFGKLVRKARAIRRAGAAAYDLALVARGTFDAFWEKGLKPWDTAAGYLLVEEAGGLVTNYEGAPFHPSSHSILAGNPKLIKSIQSEML